MSYHTSLKEAARQGTLPDKYRKTIPRSTQWRWKNENPDKYIGSELCQDRYDLQTLQQLVEKYPALFFAYGRLVKVVLDIVTSTHNFPALLRGHKDTVVHTILHVKDTLGIKKALKVFRLSRSTFDRWLLQLKAECVHNYLNLCTRRIPQQLTRYETDTMRKLLADPKFSHWGITSLAYYAMRQNLVMASPATWYKYNQLLGIRKRGRKRKIGPPKRPPYSGLRATQPNEYWHADITYYRTLDQQRYFIYLVIDNFSRYILDYYVADRIDATLRMESLRRAYAYALTVTPDLDVNLIVDGGPENVNKIVDHFLQQSSMTQQIALRDISFSNSMIEAANKSLKYRYLFPKQIENLTQLKKVLKAAVEEYNWAALRQLKPHASLHGYPPAELYHGMVLQTDRFSALMQQAREQRIAYHQSRACEHC